MMYIMGKHQAWYIPQLCEYESNLDNFRFIRGFLGLQRLVRSSSRGSEVMLWIRLDILYTFITTLAF